MIVPLREFVEAHDVFILDGRLYSSDDEELLIPSDPKYDPELRLPYAFVRAVRDVATSEKSNTRERVSHTRPVLFTTYPARPKRVTLEELAVATQAFKLGVVNNLVTAGWRTVDDHGTRAIRFVGSEPDLIVGRNDRVTMVGAKIGQVGEYYDL